MIKLILFVLFFIVGCGGTQSIIGDKTRYKSEKKEIIIYRNVSKEIFDEFMPQAISAESYKKSPSDIACKDLNSNYTRTNVEHQQNHYLLDGLLGCSEYNLADTEFKGSETYLVVVGPLRVKLVSDSAPLLHSAFSLYFKKPIDVHYAKPIIVNYSEKEMKSNIRQSWFVRIVRNVTKTWPSTIRKESTKGFVYDLSFGNTDITCEEFGFILKTEGSTVNFSHKTYMIEDEKRFDYCDDISIKANNTEIFGNKTYVLTVLRE